MASSSSDNPAQVIKLCELCDEDNVKWRCIDCDMCLCEKCKTFHLKVPITSKHQIVTIETPIQEVQRRIVTDNIPCKDHATKMNCLSCKTCDCLVCLECVSTSHTQHQFIQMEKALDDKLEYLKGRQAKIIENLKFCDSKNTHIKNLVPECNSICEESITKIKQREEELKEEISKLSKVLQERVKLDRSKAVTIITKVQQEVDEARNNLEDLKEELERTLASNQGKVIFNTNFSEPLLNFNSLPFPRNDENLISEKETTQKIQELFGSFNKVIIPAGPAENCFEVQKTFTTDLPRIRKVVPLDDTSAWISSCKTINGKPEISKISIQENNFVTTSISLEMFLHDMVLTSDNNILVTMSSTDHVMLVTKSGEIKYFLTVAPLFPLGIHVTSDNNVIVGVKEYGDTFTLTKQSQRAVMVFGMDGKQKHKYQYDRDGKRLFTFPYRIITNKNKDIFVIDGTSNNTGRLVSLDKDGNFRWIYQGDHEINADMQFSFNDIAITAVGYIIVSESTTQALHVLSENGDVLACQVLADMGINYTLSLNKDKEGKLWLGSGTGGKDSGAKLHIIKVLI